MPPKTHARGLTEFHLGLLALMLSIGHRTGLFDALAEISAPSTSAGIAAAAGLNERYMREWLGAMVVGGIVEYGPAHRTYRLPPEHAAALTRTAGPDNLAGDAIHDQAAPRRVLRGIHDALRPGGLFLMVDIAASSHLEKNLDHPLAPFLFTASTMHCTTVSLAQGGEGLGACWGEEKACALLAEAGFPNVQPVRIEGDPVNLYYYCYR